MSPEALLLAIAAALIAAVVAFLVGRASKSGLLRDSEDDSRRALDQARAEADAHKRQAELDAREAAHAIRAAVEAELDARRTGLAREDAAIAARGEALARREHELAAERDELARRDVQLAAQQSAADTAAQTAAALAAAAQARIETIAGLSAAEARRQLEADLREEARSRVAADVRRIEDEAQSEAERRSRMIVAAAVQRHAGEYVSERTVSVVQLPSDDMKGRIIGREGRNIRAIEQATGVDIIIDDTPEAVVISCFNPVRREIARLALTRLMADGRIHPSRIEEVVEKAAQEIDQQCKDAGEQALFDLGLAGVAAELVMLVGRLKFRSSNAQNLLQHSIEVAFLAGAMAGELGLPVKLARRAGLLHDIGKAVDQKAEGSHAQVGALVARRFDEDGAVCRAIEAHHGDLAASSALDHVIDAANVLSGQRPGARREMLESYVQRLTDLEKIATSFAGVERAFAIQAGREVRVLVENAKVSDEEARALSRDIARRVEVELSYPGQIRIAVIRETRATDYAK